MKSLVFMILLLGCHFISAQNLALDNISSDNEGVDNALLGSFDWLFETNNVYHCKVADVKTESNPVKDRVHNVFKVNKFNAYPDPASTSILKIEFEGDNQLISALKIHDDSGNELYSFNVSENTDVLNHQVNISDFSSSIIIISIHQENNYISKKFTIPH